MQEFHPSTNTIPRKMSLKTILRDDSWSPTLYFPPPLPLGKGSRNIKRPQPYMDFTEQLADKGRPDLIFLRNELIRTKDTMYAERGRVAVLEYSGRNSVRSRLFSSSEDLENYMTHRTSEAMGRLYIVEDIAANYVEILGAHFSVDPSIFARQLRTATWESSSTASSAPRLPSTVAHETTFSLRYPEIIKFSNPSIREPQYLFCYCNLYRKIDIVRSEPFYDGVGTINRRISFWSKKRENGAWDALLLVDPPVGDTIYTQNAVDDFMVPMDVSQKDAYQGGYINFASPVFGSCNTAHDEEHLNPPKSSIFDDIIYYETRRPTYNSLCDNPLESAHYAKKLIAAMWINTIEYIQKSVSQVEFAVETAREKSVTKVPQNDLEGLEWLENHLNYVYRWKRKCSQYRDWMRDNLMELGISFADGECLGNAGLKDTLDWIYIQRKIDMWTSRSNDVATSASGLLSLVASYKSVAETKNTTFLTILGTVYLPLSLVASLFSMAGDFIPGKPQFWIYFTVSLPLLFISLAIAFASRSIARIITTVLSSK